MTQDTSPSGSVIFLPKTREGWRELRRALREGEDASGTDWDEKAQRQRADRAVRIVRAKQTGAGNNPDDGAA